MKANKKQEKFLMIAIVCYAVASGSTMVTLFQAVEVKNKPKTITSLILLLLFLIAFICFLIAFRRAKKKQHGSEIST